MTKATPSQAKTLVNRLNTKPFFVCKKEFYCIRTLKNRFHINSFPFSLALKQRLGATWQQSIRWLLNMTNQEPITRHERLLRARVTAFSPASLFLERLCANLEHLLFPTNQLVLKTYRPINGIFDLLMTLCFTFSYLIIKMCLQKEGSFLSAGKRAL